MDGRMGRGQRPAGAEEAAEAAFVPGQGGAPAGRRQAMTDDGDFLRRWSRRKVAAKTASPAGTARPLADAAPAKVGAQHPEPTKTAPVEQALPLPPVESLTIESDFTPFMQPGVDPAVKRQALRTLVRDPRFNVMDGLDIYIGDYSISDPMPPEWLGQLKQLERLGHYIEPEDKPA